MAKVFKFFNSNPNQKKINEAAELLEKGGLIIYPTDTVYALGCLINKQKTLKRLADLKGLNLEKAQFAFFVKNFDLLSNYVRPIDNPTFKLLKRGLPGPYTFILPTLKLPKPFQKRKSIGIRISDHPILNELLGLLTVPLITTSLHDTDKIIDYTTDPAVIFERWGKNIDLMMDDGFGGNIPSTVIDLCKKEPVVIRKGKGSLNIL
ncbi:MAG: L-threonylcarbamoyladenylate synthase [Bacteroidota bacterium]|nr:L-threonylcarbamoyladenylate synthase [Bacteroidota bacterium]|tara:strand:+ start:5489 stop:6106 length:618 start_codon:yes stop_codon:yes gene_type:complete